uniref:Toxin candidate TRINITY_DN17227_c0_g1_i1 n=1 Tax=Isarachnanthus nocturnus TaxID=1240238 RepID=A0A7G7WZ11_9CNID|nr:toxin candidate TRINITY_DN17227_c0_g1_i1 [Isarachnanthus nocturnus]
MQSGLKVVAILCTAFFLQCHGAPKHMEKEKKKLTYQMLVEDYKEASRYKCEEALTPLDGCSLPVGEKSIFYRDMFTPACLRHDICYRCGVKFEWTRKECDEAFHRDMVKLCEVETTKRSRLPQQKRHKNSKRFLLSAKTKCEGAALTYYFGVRTFGGSSFLEEAKEWCNVECAKEGGDPEHTKISDHSVDKQFDLEHLKHGSLVTDEGREIEEKEAKYNDIQIYSDLLPPMITCQLEDGVDERMLIR